MLNLYPEILQQNQLKRLFFDGLDSSLFLWVDERNILRKLQFEIREGFVLEMDELGIVYSQVVSAEMIDNAEGLGMYGRAFQSKADKNVFSNAVQTMVSKHHAELVAECQKMILQERLRPMRFSVDLSVA